MVNAKVRKRHPEIPCAFVQIFGRNSQSFQPPPVYNSQQNFRSDLMAQKVIEVVGTSKESFAKAAQSAVAEAAKTVRGIKWAHVESLDMEVDGGKITRYRATTKIYFDLEK
jgi:dodecin